MRIRRAVGATIVPNVYVRIREGERYLLSSKQLIDKALVEIRAAEREGR